VNERWVCKRCFADNEDGNSACQRCGLTRGAESTDDDRAAWSAATGPSGAGVGGGLQRYLRFWWIPVVAVVLVVGYLTGARRDDAGSISDGGTLQIEDLRVGDCFDFEDAEEISEVQARPCGEPHGYEMFHVATWSGPDQFPSDDTMIDFVIDACVPAFEQYVALSYESSTLDFVPFTPTEQGWDAGDRVVQCALLDPQRASLSSSLRDAHR
jgi:hypothetical protein